MIIIIISFYGYDTAQWLCKEYSHFNILLCHLHVLYYISYHFICGIIVVYYYYVVWLSFYIFIIHMQ